MVPADQQQQEYRDAPHAQFKSPRGLIHHQELQEEHQPRYLLQRAKLAREHRDAHEHPDGEQIALLAGRRLGQQQETQERCDRGHQRLVKIAALTTELEPQLLLLLRRFEHEETQDLCRFAQAEEHAEHEQPHQDAECRQQLIGGRAVQQRRRSPGAHHGLEAIGKGRQRGPRQLDARHEPDPHENQAYRHGVADVLHRGDPTEKDQSADAVEHEEAQQRQRGEQQPWRLALPNIQRNAHQADRVHVIQSLHAGIRSRSVWRAAPARRRRSSQAAGQRRRPVRRTVACWGYRCRPDRAPRPDPAP